MKSQKVVNFPFKNFDPTPYLASIPQETILRHKELLEHGGAKATTMHVPLNSSASSLDTTEISPEHSVISDSIKEIETIDNESGETANEPTAKRDDSNYYQSDSSHTAVLSDPTMRTSHHSSTPKSTATTSKHRTIQSNQSVNMRKRLVSTSLIKSPVIDGAFIDHHDHNLNDGVDPFDLKYKLYAVVVGYLIQKYLYTSYVHQLSVHVLFFLYSHYFSVTFRYAEWWPLHLVCIESKQFVVLL